MTNHRWSSPSYNGLAANLNTLIMGVDLLADAYDIPIGSDDISQLHDLSNDASKCFSHGRTTASTDTERWRSFNETTACLQPIYHKALSSKTIRTLLSPATFLLEATVQLTGYTEAAKDILTGQDPTTTTIHAAPSDDSTQPDNTDPRPSPNTRQAVTAGGDHSCGLRSDSTITCWGRNIEGRADAPSGSFQAVTAGGDHSCGLRSDSTITCWGHNLWGQADAPSGSFQAVTAGGLHSCGLRSDSTITCWGHNLWGQADAPSGSFQAVTAGGDHSCGLRSDSTITCWGDTSSGLADVPSGSFQAVTAGLRYSCGLRSDSTITCWGDNSWGQADAPSGSFGSGNVGRGTVTLAKGGLGPTALGPGQGVPCASNTPTCRYLDIELGGFAAGTYTIACRHDGWGSVGPEAFWTFTVTIGDSGSASSNGPCFLNFARLTGNGAYVTVSRPGTETVRSNWLKD